MRALDAHSAASGVGGQDCSGAEQECNCGAGQGISWMNTIQRLLMVQPANDSRAQGHAKDGGAWFCAQFYANADLMSTPIAVRETTRRLPPWQGQTEQAKN